MKDDLNQNSFDEKSKQWLEAIISMKEMILANLVMTAQIPAKTFNEAERAKYVLNRFVESGISDTSMDKIGNVIATIPGRTHKRRILLSAHMDTLFDETKDHNVSISSERAEGTGIADNALGVTVLLMLPEIFKKLNLEFECDIVLLATAASKEKGDLAGMRHFFKHHPHIDFNLNLEGLTLGQVDHSSLSRIRCDVECTLETDKESSWRSLGNVSAIMMLNDIMDSLFSIPLPRKPKTVVNVGKILGGNSYSRICTNASLQLEVRSEDDQITEKLIGEIRDNCHDIGAKYGVEIDLSFFSRHNAAGLRYSHPLVKAATKIVKTFDIKPKMGPSNSEIAVPLSLNIPSVTVGITTGAEDSPDTKSYVDLEPIPKGILQVLLLIDSINKGTCDDEH